LRPSLAYNGQYLLPQSILKKNNTDHQYYLQHSDISINDNNTHEICKINKDFNYPHYYLSKPFPSCPNNKYKPNQHKCTRLSSNYQTLEKNWRNNFFPLFKQGK
jgi:hypothetical protein